jgi:aminocarboxymuconate-semialdehyde decarboxylase
MHLMEGTEQRLKDMDRMGLDVQVMSPVPPQFNYQADAGLCAEASQIIDDALASASATSDRLVAIGTVPLQDCARAVTEMERCIGSLGLPDIEIGANAGADELSAKRLEPFWARAEELGAAILLHPTSFASDRLSQHYLSNVVGNPLETTVAAAHLIFDGLMDR